MKILYVTYGLPYPPDSGARARDFHLITRTARHARVFLCSLAATPDDAKHAAAMKPYCESVEVYEPRPGWRLGDALRGARAGRPLAMHTFFFPEMADRIRRTIAEQGIGVLEIEHSFLAGYRAAVPDGHPCRTVLTFHNVGSQQYRRMARLRTSAASRLAFGVKALLMRGWEARWAARFDRCVVVSEPERELLLAQSPSLPVSVVENGVEVPEQLTPGDGAGNTLLFVGVMGYPPNADGALHFCDRVLPLVQRSVPDVRLAVVGHAPPASVRRLAGRPNVVVTGSVADVVPYYRDARVVVVPLRGGGGTRLKILEAMALGRPVVSTSIGCEGLHVEDGVHLEVADEPAEFAQRVIRLLRQRERRDAIVAAARQRVEERYDWPILAGRLRAVYEGVLGVRPPAEAGRELEGVSR